MPLYRATEPFLSLLFQVNKRYDFVCHLSSFEHQLLNENKDVTARSSGLAISFSWWQNDSPSRGGVSKVMRLSEDRDISAQDLCSDICVDGVGLLSNAESSMTVTCQLCGDYTTCHWNGEEEEDEEAKEESSTLIPEANHQHNKRQRLSEKSSALSSGCFAHHGPAQAENVNPNLDGVKNNVQEQQMIDRCLINELRNRNSDLQNRCCLLENALKHSRREARDFKERLEISVKSSDDRFEREIAVRKGFRSTTMAMSIEIEELKALLLQKNV